jgi:hypothetical protein
MPGCDNALTKRAFTLLFAARPVHAIDDPHGLSGPIADVKG